MPTVILPLLMAAGEGASGISLLAVASVCAVVLLTAYFTYGRLLARLLQLDPRRTTPAVALRDDVDYVPIEPKFLLSQHFSAIAAAGPIVGPILAGVAFGWLPALLWIVLGAIFIGGVHDLTALLASIRHKARSIAEIVREYMSPRSYILFLAFVWIALVYIVVAFADVTAGSFIGQRLLEDGQGTVTGGGIATSSLLYLALPIVMGLLLRYGKWSVGAATAVFLPLVGLSIWGGQHIPLQLERLLGIDAVVARLPELREKAVALLTPEQKVLFEKQPFVPSRLFHLLDDEKSASAGYGFTAVQKEELRALVGPTAREYYAIAGRTRTVWNLALLVYCVIASIIPMWLLLQPRGHLGGYFLYAVLAAGFLGIVFGGKTAQYPMFIAWESKSGPLAPLLFITIACGACSGFHAIIASGTTSKQLRVETDARPIGYGSMLLESMVAVVSLCCVMMLAADSPNRGADANYLYALGMGNFLQIVGIPAAVGVSFGLMAFTTFVYDTLDVCTRLGRYILQELFSWNTPSGKWAATLITGSVPFLFLARQPTHPITGEVMPAYMVFWSLFGASNQLLAALTLVGVTVWLWSTYRAAWVGLVTGLPAVFMYLMSMWALIRMIVAPYQAGRFFDSPVPTVASVLAVLGAMILIEALLVLTRRQRQPLGERPALGAAQPA
jgi:carbon starvation protein